MVSRPITNDRLSDWQRAMTDGELLQQHSARTRAAERFEENVLWTFWTQWVDLPVFLGLGKFVRWLLQLFIAIFCT